MSSIANQTTPSTTLTSMMTTNKPPVNDTEEDYYHTVLLVIYCVVLVCGTICLSLTMHALKFSSTSITSIAVLNLIFAHFLFLFTVPFRIYYYATGHWGLGLEWCKMVSCMIHIHMYMSFALYVIILVTRLLTFYKIAVHILSFEWLRAFLASTSVWIAVLVVAYCVVFFVYGKDMEEDDLKKNNRSVCFRFGANINSAMSFNYVMSTLVIVVATALTGFQANVLWVLYKRHRHAFTSQPDFGAQLKSLFFALILVVTFIPYHMFRLYYLEEISGLENINEVLLSLTTFNCLDMLTFMRKRTFSICLPGRNV